ncbi:MAG: DNA repair exonuclease [Streptococcaceae bacterium]|jgi:DNA repair exonuclease SbcCD nuclease subunit|nr:DNA repair exonuclease [Streptococcaceae bacterium]
MRFLHVADLHLDRSFEGILSNDLPDVTAIWGDIVSFAIQESVELVILAGDNFHQSYSSFKVQKLFFDGLKQLEKADIPVFLVFGNHDYLRKNQLIEAFSDNVFAVMSEDVATKTFELSNGETVAISGFSYEQPWIESSKVAEFPEVSQADYHIGVYHGELGSTHYAPFSLTELKDKHYDYWALGHIHVPTKLAENIYYAGTPLGHNRKETAAGVNLVTLTKTDLIVESIDLSRVRWVDLTIDLESDSLDSAIMEIRTAVRRYATQSDQTIFFSLLLNQVTAFAEELFLRIQSGELREVLEAYTHERIVKIAIINTNDQQAQMRLPLTATRMQALIEQLDVDEILTPLLKNKLIKELAFVDTSFVEAVKFEIKQQLHSEFAFEEEMNEN